jgi:hypothetical protein
MDPPEGVRKLHATGREGSPQRRRLDTAHVFGPHPHVLRRLLGRVLLKCLRECLPILRLVGVLPQPPLDQQAMQLRNEQMLQPQRVLKLCLTHTTRLDRLQNRIRDAWPYDSGEASMCYT